MGQQQILFLILGACILGIAISIGTIAVQPGSNIDHRSAMYAELSNLAAEARMYHDRSFDEGGGDGTFIGLTSTLEGMQEITATPSTPFGNFSITKSGNSSCVQILAVGFSPGNDPHKPMKMLMTVFAKRTSIEVLN